MREDLPFSREPWVDRLCRDAARRVTPLLAEALTERRLRLVFLGGGAALGEAVGWEANGESRFVLSDLDLGVVTDLPVTEPERRDLRRRVREAVDPDGPETSLGFYESRHQGAQTPTPGLVDVRARGRILTGDPIVLERFSAPPPEAIPPWESLRLLGNRALELLRAPAPGTSGRGDARAWYAAAKLGTALWTARLIAEGRYRVGWQARALLLEGQGDDALTAVTRLWRPFVEAPSPRSRPPRQVALPSLRAGLVAFFRERGYWSDPPEAGSEIANAYLREPSTLRCRLRAWRGADRRWAARARFRGTPEGRRLAASVLYWVCAAESPEPDWGDWGGPPDLARWRREATRLLAVPVAGGSGGRGRLLAALDVSGSG